MILIIAFVADVKTASKNKVPLVRSLTLSWVTFCLETSNKAVVLKVHKEYVPIFMEVSESHALRFSMVSFLVCYFRIVLFSSCALFISEFSMFVSFNLFFFFHVVACGMGSLDCEKQDCFKASIHMEGMFSIFVFSSFCFLCGFLVNLFREFLYFDESQLKPLFVEALPATYVYYSNKLVSCWKIKLYLFSNGFEQVSFLIHMRKCG